MENRTNHSGNDNSKVIECTETVKGGIICNVALEKEEIMKVLLKNLCRLNRDYI